jgi:hypothetical protein
VHWEASLSAYALLWAESSPQSLWRAERAWKALARERPFASEFHPSGSFSRGCPLFRWGPAGEETGERERWVESPRRNGRHPTTRRGGVLTQGMSPRQFRRRSPSGCVLSEHEGAWLRVVRGHNCERESIFSPLLWARPRNQKPVVAGFPPLMDRADGSECAR